MKTSLEWLSEYLPQTPSAEEAGEALTHGGLPVEVIEQVGSDRVIDVEVTSNRGDCLSHLGVARELAALLGRAWKDVDLGVQPATGRTGEPAKVTIEARDLCPHYTARVIRGVKVAPSPEWMRRRLEAVGLRPINNVVDVTNYVMLELGQPLHAFDYGKLAGRQIVVRAARQGEKLVSIDGHERALTPGMLVIADAEKPVALAGVMGGRDSEVSVDTVDVLLESARFDPLSVRTTARALAMKSDSSYRFERGIDPLLPAKASLRAAQLILQIAGGELATGLVEAGSSGYQPKELTLRLDRLERVLGVKFAPEQVVEALRRQELAPVVRGDAVMCKIPSYRLDLNIEVDLIEEVARTIGYEKIPVRDEISIRLTPPERAVETLGVIRSSLVASGYFESVTFSWVADALAMDFAPAEAKGLPRADHSVRKADGQLRPSLLPGLLESVRRNENAGTEGAKLFETGSVFWLDANGNVVERRNVALVGSTDYREVRGAVESLLTRLDPNRTIEVVPQDRAGFAPGASGAVRWGGQVIGHVGKIDRAVAGKIDLRQVPTAAELSLEPLLAGIATTVTLKPLPKFPAVRRDLSLVVTEQTAYERIESLVRTVKPEMMEDLEYVTTYRGKPLEKGQKSVTITLIFRSPTTTLTAEQVETSVLRVVEAAKKELGATLRA
jgi:phenylalanyl-tRNA synthetase beta chain